MTPADGDEEGYRRRTARVLLVDDADRLLPFRFPKAFGKPEEGHCWITPGGGVDDGESLHEAAARELKEETDASTSPRTAGGRSRNWGTPPSRSTR